MMNPHAALLLLSVFICKVVAAQNYGLKEPQDPATLPKSSVPFAVAVKKAKRPPKPVLRFQSDNVYNLTGGWEMIAAQEIRESGGIISLNQYVSDKWHNATVPGTVLTTLVNEGVYPDPAYGLNNLSIPDTLCRQAWWYRTGFTITREQARKTVMLYFNGINYEAEVWLNGHALGKIRGAFARGQFNVGAWLLPGHNSLAVHILPPPHPGIPHEESPSSGRGPNGGALCADGPTFIASEGWDWVPGIRDRNIGIWQTVSLQFTSPVIITDPQVITKLPLPDTGSADLTIKTSLHNTSDRQQKVWLTAAIEHKAIVKQLTIEAGETKEVRLSAGEYRQLHLQHPRLWWPNGYGNPELYRLMLTASLADGSKDVKTVRFGVRELSYELSVDAPQRPDWRIEYRPVLVSGQTTQPPFDNKKRRKITGETFIPSLSSGINPSLFTALSDTLTAPYLVIRVNGRRIFCKGGNWGMDDYMKRSSRAYLEPYFRLHRDAHFNMVRNWTGESTEEVFYDLCDEYGLLVWNDFWMSTEGYNIEPADKALFMENTREVVRRFRNHPSVALWCPRNEGYAPPALEDSLALLIATEDGTRHYQPQSRYLNLRTSGPWHYQLKPEKYFTDMAFGFSTELGTPAVPTAASMRRMMDGKDLWPVSDVWYYHDLHFGQVDYRRAIDSLYGKGTGLEDFCSKAQLINYDSHRAMFEAWNSRLFNNTSGLLLWMTHPAWPSTVWQVYSWHLPDVYLARVSLKTDKDSLLSLNDYWRHAASVKDFLSLKGMEAPKTVIRDWNENNNGASFIINNPSATTAISIKLNLAEKGTGKLLLPAYFSDGYFNLLPGESRRLSVDFPAAWKTKVSVVADAYNLPSSIQDQPFK